MASTPPDLHRLAAQATAAGLRAGLDAVGLAAATPFGDTRRDLVERKRLGLHGGMHFTYGNPERATDPSRTVPGARALVVGAVGYGGGDAGRQEGRATGEVARYARRDHYGRLRAALDTVAQTLRRSGWQAVVCCDDNRLVDRAAAVRAGLGWFGRNSLVLLWGRGSWFVLGSVVTDAPLPVEATGAPIPAEGCGPCRRCVSACPTGALKDGVLDARRCLAWLLEAPGVFPAEHRSALGGRLYGCDDCQCACPVNRRHGGAGSGDDGARVDLLEVLAASDAELLDEFGRWYIPRRQARYLRRNALVALGNVADGSDPQVAAALAAALRDRDPLLRAHGVWAARALGRDDLLDAVGADDDPTVRSELDAGRL